MRLTERVILLANTAKITAIIGIMIMGLAKVIPTHIVRWKVDGTFHFSTFGVRFTVREINTK